MGSRPWVQLLRRTETAPILQLTAYGLVICFVRQGLVAPFYERWHNRGMQETLRLRPVARLQELKTSKQRLLQSSVRCRYARRHAGTLRARRHLGRLD